MLVLIFALGFGPIRVPRSTYLLPYFESEISPDKCLGFPTRSNPGAVISQLHASDATIFHMLPVRLIGHPDLQASASRIPSPTDSIVTGLANTQRVAFHA